MRKADPYLEWLTENLKRPGKSQSGLARHLGIAPESVNRVVHGKRMLKTHELAGAATYFGEEPPQANEGVHLVSTGFTTGMVVGRVEAGSFREVSDLDQREPLRMQVPEDSRFPNARVLIFEASGDSMNALQRQPILEGSLLVCVSYEDIAHEYPLRTGMVVVVERTRDGGHLREWSVKQVELGEDRVEFHPHSTNPRHEPIVIDRDPHADTGTNVQIIALVRRVMTDI